MSFDKDLKAVKEKFTSEQDSEQIKQWELEHKKAELWVKLGEHPAFRELIELLEEILVGLDAELNEQEVLGQEDIVKRIKLQTKKELYTWFLTLFSSAKTKKKAIEKDVEENLEEDAI